MWEIYKQVMSKLNGGVFRTGEIEDWGNREINLRKFLGKLILEIGGRRNGFWYDRRFLCKFLSDFV
jgi:hypothetical protein